MLGFGVALDFGVGGVGAEQQRAVGGEAGYGGEIHRCAVGGGVVYLEVAGVDDHADGGCDGDAHSVGDGVADAKELYAKVSADSEGDVRLDDVQFGGFELAALAQLDADEAVREAGGIDGDVQFGQDEWERADVVFVAVRD